jgi:chemotaxis protein methyltransferase CheR
MTASIVTQDGQKLRPGSFETFASLLRAGSGLAIGPDKLYLLEARLGPIVRDIGLSGLDALADRLRAPGAADLERRVVEAMTTNESLFFRDGKPFAHVRGHSLPSLVEARPAGAKLRLWSAAASSGQEAYSLAMVADECRALLANRSVEILGTDISSEALGRAREGVYTQFEVQRGLPMHLLVKYFRKDGAQWRISDALRAMVTFRIWNLLADPRPLGKFDIVFCRNVLIYFDAPTKGRVLAAIAGLLAPDGFLYLGGAETVMGVTDRFVPARGEDGVYQLAPAPGPRHA